MEFYRALVESLAKALDTCGAWVTRYDPEAESLRALAFYFGGQWVDEFEYPIAGTPCEAAVRDKRLVHVPDRVIDLYPGDKDPQFAGVVSYLGVPILDEAEQVLGQLAVVDDRPMPDEKRLLTLFRLFAQRVAADPRFETTAPTAARVGGLEAVSMDVTLAPGAEPCPAFGIEISRWVHGVAPGERLRLYLVDLAGRQGCRSARIISTGPGRQVTSL